MPQGSRRDGSQGLAMSVTGGWDWRGQGLAGPLEI
jgi:hypothetical protein